MSGRGVRGWWMGVSARYVSVPVSQFAPRALLLLLLLLRYKAIANALYLRFANAKRNGRCRRYSESAQKHADRHLRKTHALHTKHCIPYTPPPYTNHGRRGWPYLAILLPNKRKEEEGKKVGGHGAPSFLYQRAQIKENPASWGSAAGEVSEFLRRKERCS